MKNLPKLIRHQVTNLRRHMNQSKIGSKKTTHRHIIVKLLKKKIEKLSRKASRKSYSKEKN